MGFKLGTSRQPYAVNGEIKSKLSFKNSPYNEDGLSVPGNPVIRVSLPDDIIAEANGPDHPKHPNSIYLNENSTVLSTTPIAIRSGFHSSTISAKSW